MYVPRYNYPKSYEEILFVKQYMWLLFMSVDQRSNRLEMAANDSIFVYVWLLMNRNDADDESWQQIWSIESERIAYSRTKWMIHMFIMYSDLNYAPCETVTQNILTV